MSVVVLLGEPTLSAFRFDSLAQRLSTSGVELQSAQALYLIHWRGTPAAADQQQIASLLDTATEASDAAEQLLIAPRPGTVSPWSSKASDIARVCGIAGLDRLELARRVVLKGWSGLTAAQRAAIAAELFDPLTESRFESLAQLQECFAQQSPGEVSRIELGDDAIAALSAYSQARGLALSESEIAHLARFYQQQGRSPSDAELMMYAQINSEHCRHKIFNAAWQRDGVAFEHSLFDMIRMSTAAAPDGILSAYSDNAAVLAAAPTQRLVIGEQGRYRRENEAAAIAIKVETHNHPTAIAPDPGAATGAGGEIRDEAATGRGGKPKAGLCGYSVGDLNLTKLPQAWEQRRPVPARLATPLQIMLDGPIGAARYNNEFGRPNLAGYFRTLDWAPADNGPRYGYAKPIMIAGGLGNLRPQHALKLPVPAGSLVIVLGGPGMLIGLGGGAASSVHAGASSEALDFASVQRANPELERRCQEVIDYCWSLDGANPILSIHDVGAGGLSNAVPEILHDNDLGGDIDLAAVPIADAGLSPMEIWCNESQERYVLAIAPESLASFEAACLRERCPFAVIGRGTSEAQLRVRHGSELVIDLPMAVLLGKQPPLALSATTLSPDQSDADWATSIELPEAIDRVLGLPSVAAKSFLITIGDRAVGGLVCRDQMVGPWQVPVADVAVTAAGYAGAVGEAMAMGERGVLAIGNAPASGRMAVAEALTNIAAAPIAQLGDVKLSANWMAAAADDEQRSALLATVEAVGRELCPALGIAIPVGKDSLSMQTRWEHDGCPQEVRSPVSLIISAFAPVTDVSQVLTPQLVRDQGDTRLVLLALNGRTRLGGSALAQVFGESRGASPDVDEPTVLKALFGFVQERRRAGQLLAYHDRSDGGLLVSLLEMAFAARCGLDIALLGQDLIARLFAEEVGAVVQVRSEDLGDFLGRAGAAGLAASVVATPRDDQQIRIIDAQDQCRYAADARQLHQTWAATSHQIQSLRDDPACAAEEYANLLDADDPGLSAQLSFAYPTPAVVNRRPPVAILREQGVNGHVEMAWMFEQAGFAAVDLHMSDILSGRRQLTDFVGLAACGGFSYGDVLGAGRGWAKTILLNPRAREQFELFLADPARFALGVCNGCQMLAALRELIPGTAHWPQFGRNRSEQFEARLSLVEIPPSPSIFLREMAGSRLPVVVAHGEGRAQFSDPAALPQLEAAQGLALRYVDHYGAVAQRFPANPNGSPAGLAGVTNPDGRVTIMMPHPERLTRAASFSWAPSDWQGESPWLQMFHSARRWVGD